MEPTGRDDKFKGDEEENGEEVEGWLVGEKGVTFYAFESLDGAAELDFGGGVGCDAGKRRGEHGDEDGEEEGVSEKGKRYHQGWPKDLVELGLVWLVSGRGYGRGCIELTE